MKPLIMGLAAAAAWAGMAMADTDIETGPWRLEAETPMGPLAINLELSAQDGAWTGVYVNGDDRVSVEEVEVNGSTLILRQPSYNAEMALRASDPKTVAGTLRLTTSSGPVVVAISGVHGPTHRYFENPEPPVAELDGRWDMKRYFAISPDAPPTPNIGDLRQDGNILQGYWASFAGDTRNLTGEISGDEFTLSYFDGGYGGKWTGRILEDGTLEGQWTSINGSIPASKWTAERNDNAMLVDPSTLTYLKEGYDRFEFSFPDLDGNMVSLDDPLFQDKVVLVTIGGSWCPTCHDEARFLQPWLEENRSRGVEAVGLYYEYSTDPAVAGAAIQRFSKRYGIDYPMLLAGQMNKEAASKTLPMINAVLVYPTMIVVDRQGEVRYIHTGFPGQGTGQLHEDFKEDFNELMDTLLAEGV